MIWGTVRIYFDGLHQVKNARLSHPLESSHGLVCLSDGPHMVEPETGWLVVIPWLAMRQPQARRYPANQD